MKKNLSGVLLALIMLSFCLSVTVSAAPVAKVSDRQSFIQAAADKDVTTIQLSDDIDLTGAGVLDLSGKSVYLNGNTLHADSGTLIFEGRNFSLQNGVVDCGSGGYALYLGNYGGSRNIVIDGLTLNGGIAVNGATHVTLADTYITPNSYFAITVAEGSDLTIDSGVYKSGAEGIIGLDADGKVTIHDGTFYTGGNPLAYGSSIGNPNILGGSFDSDPTSFLPNTSGTVKDGEVYTVHRHELLSRAAGEPSFAGDGNAAHYSCIVCSRLFADETCSRELKSEEVIIPSPITVTGTAATVSQTAVEQAMKDAGDTVVLNMTDTQKDIEHVTFLISDIRSIAKADKQLRIVLTDAELTFEKTALYHIVNRSHESGSVTITAARTDDKRFDDAQSRAAESYDIKGILSVAVTFEEDAITNFESGSFIVSTAQKQEEGILPSAYQVIYLPSDGEAVNMNAAYAGEKLSFETKNCGFYLLSCGDAPAADNTPGNTLWTGIIIALCVSGVMYLIYRELYQKKMKH